MVFSLIRSACERFHYASTCYLDKSIFIVLNDCCASVIGSPSELSVEGLSMRFILLLNMETYCECKGTCFRSARKIQCVKRYIKDVPSCMSIAVLLPFQTIF